MDKKRNFRVTPEMDKRIMQSAEISGLNPSAWLRKIVDENAVLVEPGNTMLNKTGEVANSFAPCQSGIPNPHRG